MVGKDGAKPIRELDLERYRALYGLTAVVLSDFAIVAVAIAGVWRLGGDKSVIIGVLTAAFTADQHDDHGVPGHQGRLQHRPAMAQAASRTQTPPEPNPHAPSPRTPDNPHP